MIAVLADDLSGAAEVAGAAFERGWRAEVQLQFDGASAADVVVVDTDTRWRTPADAAARVAQTVGAIRAARPALLFKKIDSVLRGPVLAEVLAALAASELDRALLVPANPSRQRVIADGRYYVADKPLTETVLARDPEYPRRTAEVRELLGDDQRQVTLLARDERLPARGVALPDVADSADLERRARELDERTLPVGGVEFFHAVLAARLPAPTHPPVAAAASAETSPTASPPRMLFVCGSAAAWQDRHDEAVRGGIPVVVMPDALFDSEAQVTDWDGAARIRAHWERASRVLVAIGDGPPSMSLAPRELVERFAELIVRAMGDLPVHRLYLEGGATAAAIVRRMHAQRLAISRTYGPGIVQLKVVDRSNIELITKPGSYAWPTTLWPNSQNPL